MSDDRKFAPQAAPGKIISHGFADAILRRYGIKRTSNRHGLVYLNTRGDNTRFVTKPIPVSASQVYKINTTSIGFNYTNNTFINTTCIKTGPKIKITANVYTSDDGLVGRFMRAAGLNINHNQVSQPENNIMIFSNMFQLEKANRRFGFMMIHTPMLKTDSFKSSIFVKPIMPAIIINNTESIFDPLIHQEAAQLTIDKIITWFPLVSQYDSQAPRSGKLTRNMKSIVRSRLIHVQTDLQILQDRSMMSRLHNKVVFGVRKGMNDEPFRPVQAGKAVMIYDIRDKSGINYSYDSIIKPKIDSGYIPSVPVVETYKSVNTRQNQVAINNEPAFSSGEINRLADQVYRQLERRLLLEKQRRGL